MRDGLKTASRLVLRSQSVQNSSKIRGPPERRPAASKHTSRRHPALCAMVYADLIKCADFWSDVLLATLYFAALLSVLFLTWKLSRQIALCGPQRKPQKIFLLLLLFQSFGVSKLERYSPDCFSLIFDLFFLTLSSHSVSICENPKFYSLRAPLPFQCG